MTERKWTKEQKQTMRDTALDLYEALERLLMAQSGIPVNAIEFGKWVDDARAALAKARGEK